MLGIHDFWLFVAAGLLLNITPGPDMAVVVGRSLGGGARAGMAATFGIAAGACVHIAAAALGLSVLIATSALAFAVLKWLGVAYLVFIGTRMLLARRQPEAGAFIAPPPASFGTIFFQGFWTNILNPKVALFFLAFLPQFIDADAPNKALAFVVLGLVVNTTGTAWKLFLSVLVGRIGRSMAVQGIKFWLDRVLGALFLGLGIRLAFADRP